MNNKQQHRQTTTFLCSILTQSFLVSSLSFSLSSSLENNVVDKIHLPPLSIFLYLPLSSLSFPPSISLSLSSFFFPLSLNILIIRQNNLSNPDLRKGVVLTNKQTSKQIIVLLTGRRYHFFLKKNTNKQNKTNQQQQPNIQTSF